MRTKILAFLLTAAAGYADDFAIHHVMVRAVPGELFVSTSGTPPSPTDLEGAGNWAITAKPPGASSVAVRVDIAGKPKWSSRAGTVTIDYNLPPGLSTNDNPRRWTWSVQYTGPVVLSGKIAPGASFFSAAKGKSDADIYLAGTFLAGEGTKPLYTLDAKVGWVPEWGGSGIFAGFEGTATINSTAKPPVNRTRADPDSITADVNVHFLKVEATKPDAVPTRHGQGGWLFSLYPAKGEFSRKYPESNFVPAASVEWAGGVCNFGKRGAVAFYPSVGVESGTNLNKPSAIEGTPVNLSGYNAIFRGVLGAYAGYYIRAAKPDPGNPYQFEITSTFVDRIEAFREPFLSTAIQNGKSVTVVQLGKNPREYVETDVTWNITPLLGLTAKHTWGSLPPLFNMTGQQVTIGLTFKTKLPNVR